MIRKPGFTLLELLAVIIVIGILVAIALPNFSPMRENALDKESSASLKLIQAAEKIYRMEMGFYYPNSGTYSNLSVINTDLKLALPTDAATRKWDYSIVAPTASTNCAQATRTNSLNTTGTNRTFRIRDSESDVQAVGSTCP